MSPSPKRRSPGSPRARAFNRGRGMRPPQALVNRILTYGVMVTGLPRTTCAAILRGAANATPAQVQGIAQGSGMAAPAAGRLASLWTTVQNAASWRPGGMAGRVFNLTMGLPSRIVDFLDTLAKIPGAGANVILVLCYVIQAWLIFSLVRMIVNFLIRKYAELLQHRLITNMRKPVGALMGQAQGAANIRSAVTAVSTETLKSIGDGVVELNKTLVQMTNRRFTNRSLSTENKKELESDIAKLGNIIREQMQNQQEVSGAMLALSNEMFPPDQALFIADAAMQMLLIAEGRIANAQKVRANLNRQAQRLLLGPVAAAAGAAAAGPVAAIAAAGAAASAALKQSPNAKRQSSPPNTRAKPPSPRRAIQAPNRASPRKNQKTPSPQRTNNGGAAGGPSQAINRLPIATRTRVRNIVSQAGNMAEARRMATAFGLPTNGTGSVIPALGNLMRQKNNRRAAAQRTSPPQRRSPSKSPNSKSVNRALNNLLKQFKN